jgi:hypothetical protein
MSTPCFTYSVDFLPTARMLFSAFSAATRLLRTNFNVSLENPNPSRLNLARILTKWWPWLGPLARLMCASMNPVVCYEMYESSRFPPPVPLPSQSCPESEFLTPHPGERHNIKGIESELSAHCSCYQAHTNYHFLEQLFQNVL